MAINFEMRSTSTRKNATAKLRCVVREQGVNVKFPTDITVDVVNYRKAFGAEATRQARNAYDKSDEGKRVATQKEATTAQVKAALADGVIDAQGLAERVCNVLVLDKARAKAKAAKKRQNSCILPYMDTFIKKMQSGEVKTARRKDFDESSKKHYRNARYHFGTYIKEDANLSFNDLNQDVIDGFSAWLQRKGIMKGTQKLIFSSMAAITRRAWLAGLVEPTKVGVTALWKMALPTEKEKRTEIALTEPEVDALWELANSGTLSHADQLVADMALAGIYSLQRFSDYSRFSPDMVVTVNGRRFLHFTQEKTDTIVDVPLLGRLDTVLKRHNYNFTKLDVRTRKWVPQINYVPFQNRLHKVMFLLATSTPSLREYIATKLTDTERQREVRFQALLSAKDKGEIKMGSMEYISLRKCLKQQKKNGCMGTKYLWQRNAHGQVTKQKWEMCSSHVCRRTGITLALEKGVLNDSLIQKISGHKSIKCFQTYDKREKERINANIFDALQRAEQNETKIVNIAINQ